jgi:hypothetical protein
MGEVQNVPAPTEGFFYSQICNFPEESFILSSPCNSACSLMTNFSLAVTLWESELEFRYKVAGCLGQVDKDKEEVVQGCRLPRTGS